MDTNLTIWGLHHEPAHLRCRDGQAGEMEHGIVDDQCRNVFGFGRVEFMGIFNGMIMKREIKFRAWDGTRMIDQFHITSIGIASRSNDNADDDYTESIDFPVMQFTGQYDCGSMEIYEGDIVKPSVHHITANCEI